MRWEHVDRSARTLLIPDTKTGMPRIIPLSPAALAVLDKLSPKTKGLVWNRSPDAISRAFMEVCKAAGIRGLTFHDLRHEATSRLFEKHGFSALEAAAVTGHKTMQMLKRYTRISGPRTWQSGCAERPSPPVRRPRAGRVTKTSQTPDSVHSNKGPREVALSR
ncbi:MAG: site-specific integrase [Gammaproteobacteria bacterium]|nr:site-specific integrase [Gammaproteobacteria bacterium]